ncbi:MAG: ATP-dependent DNA ligase [Candidatus Pacearchaeota archaeon]
MKYSELCEVYEKLGRTTKRLEKINILSEFLKKLAKSKLDNQVIYFLRGRVLPDYDAREFGISNQLVIKVISKASGISVDHVVKEFNKIGDLGEVAEKLISRKKQSILYHSTLSVEKVFGNLRKIFELTGKGSVDKKISLVTDLLVNATALEAKYITRTLLNDLRIGVQDSTLREAISEAFFPGDRKERKEILDKIEEVYDLTNDFALVFEAAIKGEKAFDEIEITPGKAMNVMLPVKVSDISEAFRICGKPAAIEHKYDGFRVVISKNKNNEIKLFTRRLEDVTAQFPDIIEVIKKNIKGESFIIDSEVVGYDPKTKKYKPFESISQRIKRKYHIDTLIKELPVEINAFDLIYYNGKSLVNMPFIERRKLLEKIVQEDKLKIRLAYQIITSDEKKALDFYKGALKIGEEGIMVKKLDATYKPGRRVGHMVKMKPESRDFDLVITGAMYGTGKRAGWFTSYIVSCRAEEKDHEGKFLDVGMVSSGLKEKESEGTTYEEMTKILKPLIVEEKGRIVKVKPKVVVSVTYQNIQKSPTYSSGYAMRFPRITAYRPDRNIKDIANLKDIKKMVGKKN